MKEELETDIKLLFSKLKLWDYKKYDITCSVGQSLGSASISMMHYLFNCSITIQSNKIVIKGFDKYYLDKNKIKDLRQAPEEDIKKALVRFEIQQSDIDSVSFIASRSDFEIRTTEKMKYHLIRFQPDTSRERGDKGEKLLRKYMV